MSTRITRFRTILLGLLMSLGLVSALVAPANAAPAQAAPAAVQSIVLPAAYTGTLSCGTGGYAYETDTFFNTVKWDSYYKEYRHTVTWGGKRTVTVNGVTRTHQLESIRIIANGKNTLYTKWATSSQTPEVYNLMTSINAKFTYTTRITNPATGATTYRACTTNR